MVKNSDIPLLPPGWQTASHRAKIRGGNNVSQTLKMEELAAALVRKIAATRTAGDTDHARRIVEEQFVGTRRHEGKGGPPSLSASPIALQMLDEQDVGFLPSGWESANTRAKRLHMSLETCIDKMKVLAQILTDEIAEKITQGDEKEAAIFVDTNLIGLRRSPKAGPATMSASPDATRILDAQEVPELGNWQTANMRKKARSGGSDKFYKKNMLKLKGILIQEVSQQITRGNEEEATDLVEANLIGTRRQKNGVSTITASPDALRSLINGKLLSCLKIGKLPICVVKN
jgi:hypothetical protein